jgi:predicted RNase H-like HicB family nuclease
MEIATMIRIRIALANIKEAIELVLEEYEAEAKKEGGKLIPIVV